MDCLPNSFKEYFKENKINCIDYTSKFKNGLDLLMILEKIIQDKYNKTLILIDIEKVPAEIFDIFYNTMITELEKNSIIIYHQEDFKYYHKPILDNINVRDIKEFIENKKSCCGFCFETGIRLLGCKTCNNTICINCTYKLYNDNVDKNSCIVCKTENFVEFQRKNPEIFKNKTN